MIQHYDTSLMARVNPRLAYLIECEHVPLVPRSYQIRAQFDDTAAGQVRPGSFAERMAKDAWVRSMNYTIRVPDFNAGSIFKGNSDYYSSLRPYMDVAFEIRSAGPVPPAWKLSDVPVPIEQVATPAGTEARQLLDEFWVIQERQNLHAEFHLQRALAAHEVPYTVILVVNVYELEGCCIRNVEYNRAVCGLCDCGCLTPKPGR